MIDGIAKQAGRVTVEQGIVLIDGPGNLALSLSPAAARKTGRLLINAARDARSQGVAPSSKI
jgi:hypothetical protein